MKTRHRAACYGDEQEGEKSAGKDRAGAVDEARDSGHFQRRHDKQDAQSQSADRADFEKRRQIVARREQEPHWKDRGDKAITDQHDRQHLAGIVEIWGDGRAFCDAPSVDQSGHQQHKADDAHLADFSRTDEPQIETHKDRDGNCSHHRKGTPRTAGQCLDDHEREHGENDDHDQKDADESDAASGRAHFRTNNFTKRAAVASCREEKNKRILNRSSKYHAGQDP